jgi:transglutaminase-like putative cysteine protease
MLTRACFLHRAEGHAPDDIDTRAAELTPKDMQRYQILHRTYYNFAHSVRLGPHALLLRPRENHELRVESAVLDTTPPASLRWHRDVEDNSVAIATFDLSARQLLIESKVVVQQHNHAPLDFLVADHATQYPFAYQPEEASVLSPYINVTAPASEQAQLAQWVANIWRPGEPIQTYALLQRLASHIQQTLSYQLREEPGVQTVASTLSRGTGSCRDSAFLFMEAARSLGLAARFVSGYLNAPPTTINFGATHAWAEVFLPGAGWKGFDPSIGKIVGADHIAVAVARLPESVPPVAGTFIGPPEASLNVGVWVTPLS